MWPSTESRAVCNLLCGNLQSSYTPRSQVALQTDYSGPRSLTPRLGVPLSRHLGQETLGACCRFHTIKQQQCLQQSLKLGAAKPVTSNDKHQCLQYPNTTHHRPFLVSLWLKSGPLPPLNAFAERWSSNCPKSVNSCSQRACVSALMVLPCWNVVGRSRHTRIVVHTPFKLQLLCGMHQE